MIVIYSSLVDGHARAVQHILTEEMGLAATILDLSWFPRSMRMTSVVDADRVSDVLTLPDGTVIHHEQVRAVWWRRPQPYGLDPAVANPAHREFALNEAASAFYGLWMKSEALWMNSILLDQAASRKLYQLQVARMVGLNVPETLITNDPEEARDFWETREHKMIYKAFLGTEQAWRETRLLRPEEMALIGNVRYAPVIFQEFIPAVRDLRVTVVGREIFTAEIDSTQAAYPFDVRMDMTVPCEPHTLPEDVCAGLLALMDRLGLEYGAIDMRLTPEGRYVFLEINPAGQYLYIEKLTDLPISHALARHLAEGTPRRHPMTQELAHASREETNQG